MKGSVFKTIVAIWGGIILILFIIGIIFILKEHELTLLNKDVDSGFKLMFASFGLTIPYGLLLFYVPLHIPEWDFNHLNCPNCGFDFVYEENSSLFIRCPQCHQKFWFKRIIHRTPKSRGRIVSLATTLYYFIILIGVLALVVYYYLTFWGADAAYLFRRLFW